MISGKIEIEKYSKIHKGTKNVRNPHILRTLPNFHLFEVLKILLDFICHGYCLNRLIPLRWCSNESRKNPNAKILKKIIQGTKNVRIPHILRTLANLYFFEVL